DLTVTGVQTCALPIWARLLAVLGASTVLADHLVAHPTDVAVLADREVDEPVDLMAAVPDGVPGLRLAYRRALVDLAARDLAGERSEERRVGKEGRSRG